MKAVFLLVIALTGLIFISSCDSFNTSDLIEKSEEVKNKHTKNIRKLIIIAEEIAEEECVVYNIHTSKNRTYFAFDTYKYDSEKGAVVLDMVLEYTDELEKNVRDVIPYDEITSFTFVKGVYVDFPLNSYRDKQLNYASIIYIMDKEKLIALNSDLVVYNNESVSDIKEEDKWIYFIDDEWAISTTSFTYKMSKTECHNAISK